MVKNLNIKLLRHPRFSSLFRLFGAGFFCISDDIPNLLRTDAGPGELLFQGATNAKALTDLPESSAGIALRYHKSTGRQPPDPRRRRKARKAGSGQPGGQVPVLLQDRLQAIDAGLVDIDREGREEFLGHAGR